MADQYDRALTRLSTTEDHNLPPVLAKLLPIVFDELLTVVDPQVRKKLIQVLNSVLTRSKGNPAVKLPVLEVAQRWFTPNLATSPNGPFFRNLSLIFIDLGLPRLAAEEQVEVSMLILGRFGNLSTGADRVAMFSASLPGLGLIASEAYRKLQIPRCIELCKSGDAGLASFFHLTTEFLLIPCGGTEAPSVSGMASTSWAAWKARLKAKPAADMITLKTSVLRWLGALATGPPAALLYAPSLAATVENYDVVSSMAETNCKRIEFEMDLERDQELLGRLTCIALTEAPPVEGALRVEAKASVPMKLRQRVLTLLQRSKVHGIGSRELAPYVVHLISQCFRDHEQVQSAALQLGMVLAENVDPECLPAAAAVILREVEAVFWPGGGVISMGPSTPLAFRVFGSFTRQLADRASSGGRSLALTAAPQLLRLLNANPEAAQDILEGLSGFVGCVKDASHEEQQQFVPLLDELVRSSRPVVRLEVLRWASSLFPPTSPEGRYYALRLLSDADAHVTRSAQNMLSVNGRAAPPFGGMCVFLAERALETPSGERVNRHVSGLAADPPSLPQLASGFSRRDIGSAVVYLVSLAVSEGLHDAVDASGPSLPVVKKPRLDPGAETPSPQVVVEAFVALLDYSLLESIQGADGHQTIEISLSGLLLASSLATEDSLLGTVKRRAELVLLTEGKTSPLFRDGGVASRRLWRLSAKVLGKLGEQFEKSSQDPVAAWLDILSHTLEAPVGDARRAGGVLAICELLRVRPSATMASSLCQKMLQMLVLAKETDPAALTAVCDGLRRISEQHRLVWDTLESLPGVDAAATRSSLLDRLYSLSSSVTTGLGDIKTTELSVLQRDLAQSSWRLLGQLASWGRDGSEECIEKLIAVGRKATGEEAAAAVGLALLAASQEPGAQRSAPEATEKTMSLVKRLMTMASLSDQEDTSAAAANAKVADNRCAAIWLAVIVRSLAEGNHASGALLEALEPICRIFVHVIGELCVFAADCSQKGLVNLYRLAPPDVRTELLKAIFLAVSNRGVTGHVLVTREQRVQMIKGETDLGGLMGHDSLKLSAKERVDALKDLIFLAREVQHPPLFIALLDQPVASVWASDVFLEAVDLQTPCLPEVLQGQLCPVAMRPKLFPQLYNTNTAARQAIVALVANYFGCETPQALLSKYPDDWPLVAKHLVTSLGASRVATREASIAAANVLIPGKKWSELKFFFYDFWEIVVKLSDDAEERIKAVIKPLLRMTRNLTLRLCDAREGGRDVDEAIAMVAPMLLKFMERFPFAMALYFDVLRELVKNAQGTDALRPYVQDLIPPLIMSLSELEHGSLSYYQAHLDARGEEKAKELNAARISASRDSVSMKLIRQMVPLLTPENAEDIAPRTRDLLKVAAGANCRVGVCDFWQAVCAERATVLPADGKVAAEMLRATAGALMDVNKEVRKAAASCFASLARHNSQEALTKVVSERMLKRGEDTNFVDDTSRNAYRVPLALALSEICRRCGESAIGPDLKASIAARAFPLRYSEDDEVRISWESLWSELFPSNSAGIERHHRQLSAELASIFSHSNSRTDKKAAGKACVALCVQLEKMQFRDVGDLHQALLGSVKASALYDGIGVVVRALAAVTALLHRRRRNEESEVDEESSGLPLVLGYCSKGSLEDRTCAVEGLLDIMVSTRLWSSLDEIGAIHVKAASKVDELQKSLEAEPREPGEIVPKRYRGKPQSPAEELLTATLNLCAGAFEQCRREVEDEGDLDPPQEGELSAFVKASLAEYQAGSLNMRLVVVRVWKRVTAHLASERLAVSDGMQPQGEFVAALQDASLDDRSDRLRRPALELAGALAKDSTPKGGRELLSRGFSSGTEGAWRVLPLDEWLSRLDGATVEKCKDSVDALRLVK